MKGLVNLPAFDTDFFKQGQAVRVTWGWDERSKSTDCLIVTANPVSLEVCYWNPIKNEFQHEFILSSHVAQQNIVVEALVPSIVNTGAASGNKRKCRNCEREFAHLTQFSDAHDTIEVCSECKEKLEHEEWVEGNRKAFGK